MDSVTSVNESAPLEGATFEALYRISNQINSITEIDELLEATMDIAVETLLAERGFLVLRGMDDDLSVRVARNIAHDQAQDLTGISTSIVQKVIQDREPVLTVDAQEDPRFAGAQSVILQNIQSAACVPFHLKGKTLGAIYLDSRLDRSRFTDKSLRFLTAFANNAAIAIENAQLLSQLREENIQLRQEVQDRYSFAEIVGNSPAMEEVFELLNKIAGSDISVLLEGESGTGKELVAKALHYNGARREKPFIAQFCGNLSESLLESELFGHRKGSFTGAIRDKKGLFEVADGGTFFLDEIADIPPLIQAKLLRVLQDGEIRRVGDTEVRHVDVRIISATNRSLEKQVETGRFREDLFYRLNVITIKMPPLRERKGDIPLLVRHFLDKFAIRTGSQVKKITQGAMRALENYNWPGNVRELENTLERAVVLSQDRSITLESLIIPKARELAGGRKTLKEHEKEIVVRALEEFNGNKTKTAESLGVSLRWLHYKLAEWRKKELVGQE
jgi:Nif-specific regulatory protein